MRKFLWYRKVYRGYHGENRTKLSPKAIFLKVHSKDLIIIFFIMLAFYLQHLLSFRLGINFEEGRDGNAYFLALQGFKPYADFEWVYGPFSFLIYPLIMKIFGVNLLVMRLSYIAFASLVIPLSYALARGIMPPTWSAIASFLAVNLFDVPYYTYNHIFAVLGELGCLLMIVRCIKTNRDKTNIIWAGFFTTIVLLTKPIFSGVILFFSVFLFLIILKRSNQLTIKFTNAMILYNGTVFLITALFVYFYLGNAIRNFFLESIPLFSPNPVGSLYNVGGTDLSTIFSRLAQRFFDLFAINRILTITSINMFKKTLVDWFDNFIFCLPFLIPVALLVIYSKFKKTNTKIQKIFSDHKITILFFIIFSVLISTENLVVAHRLSRAFNIQTTFILLVFFFYLLVNIASKKTKAFTFSLVAFFIFSLTFLHSFRYPWSRNKKYTEALNLKRAKGVLVTPAQKRFYESLATYLSSRLSKENKMVVLGYHPQYNFLTGQKKLFANEECIFLKLEWLTMLSLEDKRLLLKLKILEDEIISMMKIEKPKIVLVTVYDRTKSLHNKVTDYIKQKYSFKKTFGPAEIRGAIGRVDVYLLKGS